MSQDIKKIKKFFNSCWFLFLMLITFFVFLAMFLRVYYQDYQVKKEIEQLKEQAKNMEAKKIESLDLLKYFNSSEYIEKTARLDMDMAAPGERAAVIKNLDSTIKDRQVEVNMVKSDLPNYKKWWNYFFNHN